ncbi:MAG: hypothetical protein B6244_07925 [Candidatus Cloacimonetes bacterium 4572_55]|nr:MAG: hypothetical protein B6244_07925 [Candidatus Cloacimonetes bacterium 4572_55]
MIYYLKKIAIGVLLLCACHPHTSQDVARFLRQPTHTARAYDYIGHIEGAEYPCGSFSRPSGLAVDLDDHLYVADSGNHRVCKFGPDRRFLLTFGEFGWDAGQFQNPVDIATDRSVHIYVVDSGNNRVEKYSHQGVPLSTLFDEDHASFERLAGIGFGQQGEIYVTDQDRDQILRFDLFGNLLGAIGGFGYEPGNLNRPRGIWVAESGDMYVADAGNERIQAFNAIGNVKREFLAVSPSLKKPTAVTGDQNGNIFVADAIEKAIFVFDQKGELLLTIRDYRIQEVADLAIDRQGVLYIADIGMEQIHLLQIEYEL